MPAEQEQPRRRGVRAFRRVEPEAEPVTALAEADTETRGVSAGKGRPTPSRRQIEAEADEPEGNIATRQVSGLVEYFQGVRSELQKVTWPTREEARRLVTIVLITLIIASIILGAISGFFTELFRLGLNNPLILLGFMIIAIAAGLFLIRTLQRQSSY